ncbi:GNAT family N-acetyltransferase (plasmid) [Haloimpatiens sp. FM7330]|uniref:GNAT family N-acetyltransferase n=1 Tax=Haloimpatiens sp. FM7330 TaxID=3298610 RepID=UPI0036397032
MKIKNNDDLTIREAKIEDAKQILQLVKKVMSEVEFFPKAAEEFQLSVEQEEEFIEKTSLVLVAEIDGKIVGASTLQKGNCIKNKHVADFGITILQEYSNLKIGSLLMEKVIEWSKENEVEKIELEVFEKNIPAINLYKKFGFIVEGRRNRNIKIRHQYQDTLLMCKFLYN